jgi:tryptophan-rich sensory protein
VQIHYILIPLIGIGVVMAGSLITRSGIPWYRTLRIPSWTPPAKIITGMWTILAVLTCVSAILAWDGSPERDHGDLAALYLVNAFLNVAFSYLFFVRHQMGSATLEAMLLAISVVLIAVQVWATSWVAAFLLLPYLLWVLFATCLSFTVFHLNAESRSK